MCDGYLSGQLHASYIHMGNGPVGVSVGIISITLVEVGRPAHCGWDCSLGEEDLGLYKQTR